MITLQRPDCVAGHVGLELANDNLEKPLKYWGNSHWNTEHFATRDFSRASCQATDMQLRLFTGIEQGEPGRRLPKIVLGDRGRRLRLLPRRSAGLLL
jgi:hypothetical protein